MKEFLKVMTVGLPLLFGVFWLFSRLDESQQVQRSPADYEACIRADVAEYVQNCYRASLQSDMKETREELPWLPSPEERLQQCKANVPILREKEKYYHGPCGKKPE
jgi:hypothetical protein